MGTDFRTSLLPFVRDFRKITRLSFLVFALAATDPVTAIDTTRRQTAPAGPFAVEYFVAPTGSAAADGSREKPFASLERARDAVRSLKAKEGLPGAVAVRLLPGEYAVKATFELGAGDSGTEAAPIVYLADRKGTVVLYGGRRLHEFLPVTDPAVLARIPEVARGKVVVCGLRKQSVTNWGEMVERGYGVRPPAATLELFFNGEPMRLARWPNEGFVNGVRVIEPGKKHPGKPSVFEYADDRHARWAGAEDAWLFGYFRHGWADRQIRVLKIEPITKQISCGPYLLGDENMEPVQWFNKGLIKYYAFNLLEELDAPGEWYLDRRSGVLYLYPPSEPAKAIIEIGEWPGRVLSLREVSDVRFEGVVFDLGRGDAISIVNSRRCLIVGCTIKRFAGSGILVHGGAACGIVGCDIHSLGRRATEVIGGDRQTLTPGRHFVENCWMQRFGRLDKTYVPAVQLEGCGNRVAHNLFEDCPSSVVRIEGNDHILEFNRVYRAILESEDQGAMELFGNPTYRGVVFRYNHFSDLGPAGPMEGTAGRAAIRLDDTISGLHIHGNIFHRAAQSFGAININGGRDNRIENNLFAECEKGVTGQYNRENKHWERVGKDPAFILSDLYLERYPDLARLAEQPGLNYARRNVFWRCGPRFSTYGKPSEEMFELQDNTEAAADDPGLTAAAAAGFRSFPNSPVFDPIGFQPIPVAGIGLYEDPHRASWPVPIGTARSPATPASGRAP
jgi:hypothetical protein